ncbi:hypothetical protein F383_06743 [Gossypium arboreum]|uniref:Uncharacterized protein n=1 Tax=Gossypium arboreum TaxID=29729 RepID=A0A0B0P290_GOSAR|nr:hypothetical protein F383_06743 [Gossypium arboreum]
MKRLLQLIVLLILRTLITELLLKFWVLKEQMQQRGRQRQQRGR